MARTRAKHDTAIEQQNAATIQAAMWVAWAKQHAVRRESMAPFANTNDDSLSILATKIENELQDAAETLRTMPDTYVAKLGYGSSWPEVVRNFFESYEVNGKVSLPRIVPTQTQVDQLFRVLDWLGKKTKAGRPILSEREQRIVWAYSCRLSFRKIAKLYAVSDMTIQREYRVALIVIGLCVLNPC